MYLELKQLIHDLREAGKITDKQAYFLLFCVHNMREALEKV